MTSVSGSIPSYSSIPELTYSRIWALQTKAKHEKLSDQELFAIERWLFDVKIGDHNLPLAMREHLWDLIHSEDSS